MGVDVISRARAWDVYAQIMQDPRVTFFGESSGLEAEWRSLTQSPSSMSSDWTDTYLLAFAKVDGLTIVSFDQAFKTVTDPPVIILHGEN